MAAEVILTEQVKEDIQSLPLRIAERVRKLVRTGDYRLQFRVESKRVKVKVQKTVKGKPVIVEVEEQQHRIFVERAGHRDGFYKG